MGVWGVNIFDDDLALDIKDEYLEIIELGYSHSFATQTLTDRHQEVLKDPEDKNTFWLAIATVQLEYNALLDHVKVNALTVINSGLDLLRWSDNPQLLKKRKTVLEQLKKALLH